MAGGFRIVVNTDASRLTAEALEDFFIEKLGPRILDGAHRAVPVDTGDLKRSIIVQVDRQGSESTLQVGVDESIAGVDYGRYVEYGTSRTRMQPYLRPAVLNAGGRF